MRLSEKKGNISILVIFVLIACSLIGVLTMNFINQMLFTYDTTLSYYKSYYLANAGLELLLTEAKSRGIGFETNLATGNTILKENFGCSNCDFAASVSGTSYELSKAFWKGTGCADPLSLGPKESFLLPLIKDTSSGTILDAFSTPIPYQNISENLKNLSFTNISGGNDVVFGILILSGNDLYSDGIFFRSGSLIEPSIMSDFLSGFENRITAINLPNPKNPLSLFYTKDYSLKNYFIIANPDPNKGISFCISSPVPLPTDNFYIKSIGTYHKQTLGLELISKQPIPGFLLNTYFGN